MASDRPVTLTVWRDAKTDPPEETDGLYQTDTGFWHYHDGRWVGETSDGLHFPAKPQPTAWCDPTPPTEDALTLEDLEDLYDFLRSVDSPPTIDRKLHRLRRALDSAEAQP